MMDLSDEEVLEAGDDDDDDDVEEQLEEDEEDVDEEDSEEDGDELSGFGASRSDYYGADALETEQDALEEEEEARRIQQKNLKALKAADFGFDENEWAGAGEQDGEQNLDEDKTVMEVLPQVKITEDMGPAERLKLLKQRYPLFEPLSREFLNLQDRHTELAEVAVEAQKTASSDLTPIAVIQYRAISGYLGALAMYFALLTSTATNGNPDALPLSPQELQNHPIFTSIEDCQRTWQQVKDLEEDDFVDSESDEAEESTSIPVMEAAEPTKSKKSKKSAPSTTSTPTDSATAASLARRAARLARTEASLAALSTTLATKSSKNRKLTSTTSSTALVPTTTAADNSDSASDLGDEAPLTTLDAAEKARRKKSLRFYTSQIAQKAAKRAAAGRIAGGDEDVPYRERFRDRQERLNREAEAKGRKGRLAGVDLGDGDDDDDGEGVVMTNREREEAAANGNGGEGDDDATRLLAGAAAKKQTKASRAAAYRLAAKQGGSVVRITDPSSVDADGKRAVGYTIEKNKGLMPRRKKEVKNPRVKKRKKYEEKTKKLASMKPVFKAGGEGRGGYQGQLTGIKTGLVKSVKF